MCCWFGFVELRGFTAVNTTIVFTTLSFACLLCRAMLAILERVTPELYQVRPPNKHRTTAYEPAEQASLAALGMGTLLVVSCQYLFRFFLL